MYQTLDQLQWGKFKKYSSKLYPEKAWRVGTIGDGSCFVHAILTAVNKKYRSIHKKSDRSKEAARIRKIISNKITESSWEKLQNGEPAHFELLQQLNTIDNILNKVISNPNKYKKSTSKKWIIDSFRYSNSLKIAKKMMLPLDLSNFTKACKDERTNGYVSIKQCKNIFVTHNLKNYVDKVGKNLNKLIQNFDNADIENSVVDYKQLLENVVDKAEELGVLSLRNYFASPTEWIGTEYLSFLGNQFNSNIFILDGNTGLPYITGDMSNIQKGRNNIILLSVNETHFETIGFEIESITGNTRIKCKLPWSHPNIQKIYETSINKNKGITSNFNMVIDGSDNDSEEEEQVDNDEEHVDEEEEPDEEQVDEDDEQVDKDEQVDEDEEQVDEDEEQVYEDEEQVDEDEEQVDEDIYKEDSDGYMLSEDEPMYFSNSDDEDSDDE
jgi:hypothetical protein